MSAYLIDTQILLWAWHQPERIPRKISAILERDPERYVSLASLWEIAIKVSIGKLETVSDPYQSALETGCKILAIERNHIRGLQTLPLHHRDPFDRLLIVQAQSENLIVLTADDRFLSYRVEVA